MSDYDVCVVGSANLDIVATTTRHPAPGETVHGYEYHEYPGGKGLNQAVAAARAGSRVAFIGAVGDDSAGVMIRDVLAADDIDAGVSTVAGPTGRAVIVVDAHGENAIVVVAGANAEVTDDAPLPHASVVLCQLEIPQTTVASAFRRAQAVGATTVLNPAPAADLLPDLLAFCDVIVPNEHEVELLGGPRRLLAAGCDAVVVTRGGQGVDIHDPHGTRHVNAFEVDVVDTTGAGDAFCGSLAGRLASGVELGEAVTWAAAAGALATTVPGAVPAQPSADAVSALLMAQGHG